MKRPWQIWLLFALCLAVVLPAMGWLTVKVLELDRAQELGRREAELERLVSQTLWNMDNELIPLVGQEAARPYFVYDAFNDQPVVPGATLADLSLGCSPIIVQPDDYVLLHFQVGPEVKFTSPQCPSEQYRELALMAGNSKGIYETSRARLAELSSSLNFTELLTLVPQAMLPRFDPRQALAGNPQATSVADASANNFLESQTYWQNRGIPQQAAPPSAEQPQIEEPQTDSYSDYSRRNSALQNYTQEKIGQQQLAAAPFDLAGSEVAEGIASTFWLDNKLLMARRVLIDGESYIQGCWFNWARLQVILREQVAAGMPAIELKAVDPANPPLPNRALVTLPIELVVPPPAPGAIGWSPLRLALAVAWGGMLAAALASAALLLGVVRLSERRGDFVSAVTHELRTPLTTFRMYSEMLAEGMVPEEKQRHYLETLRGEADRLSHLVENVLSYARLERGRKTASLCETTCGKLLNDMQPRLEARAAEAGLDLQIELPDTLADMPLRTDPVAVEQILFNLVDNACKYAACGEDKSLELAASSAARGVQISLRDHGPGIRSSETRKLFRPFSKSCQEAAATAPGVGLGLALCRRLAQQLGGRLEVAPAPSGGSCFTLTLPRAK